MTVYPLTVYKEIAFYVDGSLRDIYVKKTDKHDWKNLLKFLQKSTYSIQLIVGDEKITLPERVEDIFDQKQPCLLCVDQEHLGLNCHFFTEEEIEFDLDPELINTDQRLARLIDFIHVIGRLLRKEVFLTPENRSEYPLFRFDPITNIEMWLEV